METVIHKNNAVDTNMRFNIHSSWSIDRTDGESVRPAVSGEPGAPRTRGVRVTEATDGSITPTPLNLGKQKEGQEQRKQVTRIQVDAQEQKEF